MGKRELLIAVIFIAIGIAVYEVSAPATPSGSGFSIARFFSNARSQLAIDSGHATLTRHGTLDLSPEVTEIRVARVTRIVRVVGEDRRNLDYELLIDSTGTDDAAALASARQTTFDRDDLGEAVTLTVNYPPAGRQTSQVLLRVPARVTVWVDGTAGAGADVRTLRGVHLDGVAGDTTISGLTGALTGTFHGGRLTVDGAQSVAVTLQSAESSIQGVRGPTALTLRAGSCRVDRPAGPVDVDATNTDLTIDRPAQAVHVGGVGGRVAVSSPRGEVTIDARRTTVTVTMAAAVAATIITTDEPLRLTLDGPPAISLDAVASEGGAVHADDFALHAESHDETERLATVLGAGGPRVVLRDQRADIVIARMK